MDTWQSRFDRIDIRFTSWMARYGVLMLRLSLGTVFFWFGVLKFVPDLSAAQDLALRTIDQLTFGLVPHNISIVTLAAWECLIGLGLILGLYMRVTLLLLWMQMLGTISPLFLFPAALFIHTPGVPTLEGQYIIKNIIIVAASIVIGATVRGGKIVASTKETPQ
ncbi:MAG: DoxX family membrane protein [Chitinivibrionales bacterium]|nr:DoxX family membrane protein [Chitinivibrionales bacterium]